MAGMRELDFAERRYLIANDWHSIRVRGEAVWKKPYLEGQEFDQDGAVAAQKKLDREITDYVRGKR